MSLAARAFPVVRPLLHALEPERAHRLTIDALARWAPSREPADDPLLAVDAFGLRFPNPVGLAAGFDKNAEVPDAMLALGCGFVEVGTLTPLPQAGNPKPRVFRLPGDRALINRLGFNNEGLDDARRRLASRRGRPGIVGGNVGANKDSADRIADYVAGVEALAGLVDYLAINISSPNTPGLRALQSRAALDELIERVMAARGAFATPILVKVAPDIADADVADIAEVALARGIDGLIVSNTTIGRPDCLVSRRRGESGGLSGAPLFAASTHALRRFRVATEGRLTLVGVGGVGSGADAYAKLQAGASLIQLYTALVYEGPALLARIKEELVVLLRRHGPPACARNV